MVPATPGTRDGSCECPTTNPVCVAAVAFSTSHRADGKGEAWDLPAIAQGSRFNGGAVAIADLKPVEVDSSFSW